MNNNEIKIFGRWHELCMMLIGFLLTGVLGTVLTNSYRSQSLAQYDLTAVETAKNMRIAEIETAKNMRIAEIETAKNMRIAEKLRWETDQATAFYAEFSHALDTRRYNAYRLVIAYRDKSDPQKIAKIYDRYIDSVISWNENINRYIVFCERFFGATIALNYELEISSKFRGIHQELLLRAPDTITLLSKLDSVGVLIYDLNFEILKQIQEGRIGSFNSDIRQTKIKPDGIKLN